MHATTVTAGATNRHDPVAGDDDRQRIAAAGAADSARTRIELPGDAAVRHRFAGRDASEHRPYAPLKRCAAGCNRKIEAPPRVLEIAMQLVFDLAQQLAARFAGRPPAPRDASPRSGGNAQVTQSPQRSLLDIDPEPAQRRSQNKLRTGHGHAQVLPRRRLTIAAAGLCAHAISLHDALQHIVRGFVIENRTTLAVAVRRSQNKLRTGHGHAQVLPRRRLTIAAAGLCAHAISLHDALQHIVRGFVIENRTTLAVAVHGYQSPRAFR